MMRVLEPPPVTPVEPLTEVLHGVEITDPYRWLEDQDSIATRRWLQDQSRYTRAYFDSVDGREIARRRVIELLSSPSITESWKVGERYFFLKRQEGREQPAIVMRNGLFGEETMLVDPALRASGASTAIAIAAISHDGRFLAYTVRQGGTDYSALEFLDIEANTLIPDRLSEGFCTGFAFAQDGSGFYYAHRAARDSHPDYKSVFWHRFGSDCSQDVEQFHAGVGANLFLAILASTELQLLVYVVLSSGKNPATSLYVQKMEPCAAARSLLRGVEGCFVPIFAGAELLAFTDFAAPNARIVSIDLERPEPSHWRDVVRESDRRIQQFAIAGDQIFITRVDRFKTLLEAFRIADGERVNVPLALQGTVDLLTPPHPTDTLFYSVTSITMPPAVHCYDTRKKASHVWQKSDAALDPSMIAIEEAAYCSKDGASIPIFLAARKDVFNSGPLPAFLTGYGGFGNCVTPRFSAFATFLIEQGMLLAVPALRGGSELGEEWHRAGQGALRQTSFDDFIAAAEWLLDQGYSAQGRIAIGGGSNAGLLVGAAVTQRPELFRAALCLGPLLDMTRFHLFDFAAGWTEEYGSPDDEQDFQHLLGYSPYHHIHDGTKYPAVLLISGDADTRCNPMHARKMAARLQTANGSVYPILLDYKSAWGHTPVQPLSTKIESLTDRLTFVCHELGVEIQRR